MIADLYSIFTVLFWNVGCEMTIITQVDVISYNIIVKFSYCKPKTFRMHQIFANCESTIKSRNCVPTEIQFANRIVGKFHNKMQLNFNSPKSQN